VKVIQVAGFSSAGKTSFILKLLSELEKLGPVGVVKHIGHHGYALAEGKDTTLFFETGADASIGIDTLKSMMILQEKNLENVLELLSDMGIQNAVIEGFKEKSYPKIAIGNLPGAMNIILQDPAVEDVLLHLGEFRDLVTPGGVLKDLQMCNPPGTTVLVSTVMVQRSVSKDRISDLKAGLNQKVRSLGNVTVRLEYIEKSGAGEPCKFIIGISSPQPDVATRAALAATENLLPYVAEKGVTTDNSL
jgi:molybdopterin-guanine dinucleotide biosynthesis protein MobB